MTLKLTDLSAVQSTIAEMSLLEYRSRSIARSLTDARYNSVAGVGRAQRNNTIDVPRPDTNVVVTERTRGADYPEGNEAEQVFIQLALDKYLQTASTIPYEDEIQSIVNYIELFRSQQSIKIGEYMDSHLFGYMTDPSVSKAYTHPAAQLTLGADNPISVKAPTEDIAQAIILLVDTIKAKFRDLKVLGGAGTSEAPYVAAHYAFLDMIERELLFANWNIPQTNERLFRSPQLADQAGYRFTLRGINFYEADRLQEMPATAGTDTWKLLCGIRKAVAVIDGVPIVQLLTPAANQKGPDWKLTQLGWFGRQAMLRTGPNQTTPNDFLFVMNITTG